MRRTILRGTLTSLGLLCLAGAAHAQEKIAWAKSLPAALAQARATNKLVMADFYTVWCGWCTKLDQEVYTDPKVIKLLKQFVPVKINAEKEGVTAASKYGVRGYPDLLFLEASGELAGRIHGYMPPAPFAEKLSQIAESHRAFPALQARLKAKPGDVEAAARLAAIYAARADEERAVELLALAEKGDAGSAADYLTRAYNAVGDHFQAKRDFDRAIPLFRKAVAIGRVPYEIGYARLSIAVCALSQQKPQDAIPELEATLAIPNLPADLKQQAQQMLTDLKKPPAR